MSSTTWDSIYSSWASTTLTFEQPEQEIDDLLRIYTKAELNDLFNAQIGNTPNTTKYTIGSIFILLLELLKTNNIDALSATELSTTSLNLPQASLEDIAVTTGSTITGDKILLLQVNGTTYKLLAEEI
jgi:hypothetical protein